MGHAYLCSEITFANINDYIIHNIIITVIVRSPQARCVECAGNAVTHYSNTHLKWGVYTTVKELIVHTTSVQHNIIVISENNNTKAQQQS